MSVRVLHTVESATRQAGSVAICLDGLAEALRARGVESLTAASEPNGRASVIVRPSEGPARSDDLSTLVDGAEVIHIHGWGGGFNRRVAAVAGRAGKPYVVSPLGSLTPESNAAGSWKERLRAWWTDRRLLRGAAALAAMNESEEHALNANKTCDLVVYLPYGLDMAAYDPAASTQPATNPSGTEPRAGGNGNGQRRRFLILGPIHPVEGLVPFLKALSELGNAAEAWDVVIAGEEVGDWRKQLEAAIRRKGGADRVIFVDAPDVPRQRARLEQAHILVAPSLRPRCCVSVLQAIAAGVPVLATRCVAPTTREDVLHVCAPTRGDLKLGLRELLSLGEDGRVAFAKRAREVGQTLFDWSVLADRYVTLYEESARRDAP